MKLSQVISKLEEKGLHKSAENVKRIVKGQYSKVAVMNFLEDHFDKMIEKLSKLSEGDLDKLHDPSFVIFLSERYRDLNNILRIEDSLVARKLR